MNNLSAIYEDSHILVLNKPSGMVVNRSQTTVSGTVQDEIASMIQSDDEESEFFQRGGIVHRLDKDTSGVLLVAKDEDSFQKLQAQFKKREVEKEYFALVIGEIGDEYFQVNAPIGRNPRDRFKFAVVKDGKEAVTQFLKVNEITVSGEKLTLLKAMPKTGRTHQIRVHLAALNHPVVADPIYSTNAQKEKWEKEFPRLMLHAQKISVKHPQTGETVYFEAPLPDEFNL